MDFYVGNRDCQWIYWCGDYIYKIIVGIHFERKKHKLSAYKEVLHFKFSLTASAVKEKK